MGTDDWGPKYTPFFGKKTGKDTDVECVHKKNIQSNTKSVTKKETLPESESLGWEHNQHAKLWPKQESFFEDNLIFTHIRQSGPTCVPTSLAIIANAFTSSDVTPDFFMSGEYSVNTQSPHDWSKSLKKFGIHLAYCNFAAKKLRVYVEELLSHNDLFVIGFYSNDRNPDIPFTDAGWAESTGSSHLIILYKGTVYDSAQAESEGGVELLENYNRLDTVVKRIFRVVPASCKRRL